MTHDLHVHSTYSDGADPLEASIATAERRGLTTLGFVDHVRKSTDYLPDYVAHLDRLRSTTPIKLLTGVEAKILTTSGEIDLPEDLTGISYIAIADHQVPGEDGPRHPDAVREALEQGLLTRPTVVEEIVEATRLAVKAAPVQPMVAHLFSILPKIGLREDDVPSTLIHTLGKDLANAGAWVEINEKWECPSRRVAELLAYSGVKLVLGSDSHRAEDVGEFDYVAHTARGLVNPQGPID